MNPQARQLPPAYQITVDHFVAACQADARVVAAFLRGSYSSGAADAYSDLDLGLITTDEAYEDFVAGNEAFMRLMGEPLFLESFNLPNFVFFFFSNGTEGELSLGRVSDFHQINRGAYHVLLDKEGLLTGAVFTGHEPAQAEQIETARRLIAWYWHDLSHFITAMGRGQLWWAHGQLEELRRYCVDLARLRHDFSAEPEGYEKIEQALPVEQLSPLQATYCSLEDKAMLQAGLVITRFYQNLARFLARTYNIPYLLGLERLMLDRLEQLCKAHSIVFDLDS
jgi:Streptomycin adenylyltransferase